MAGRAGITEEPSLAQGARRRGGGFRRRLILHAAALGLLAPRAAAQLFGDRPDRMPPGRSIAPRLLSMVSVSSPALPRTSMPRTLLTGTV